MKIALIGYGKMGKSIEKIALENGDEIVAIIDRKMPASEINRQNLKDADVCIDFSHPSCILDNIKKLAELQVNIIVGTTGWYSEIDTVKKLVDQHSIGFLYAPNFSIGVHIFLKIIDRAASLIRHFDEYDVGGFEIHHHQKADSPSGTAKAITATLLKQIDRKKRVVYDQVERQIEADELHYASLRSGSNPGAHTLIFDSESDSIEIKHTARDRNGFAKGALLAARWLYGKRGFYTMNDLFKEAFHA